MKLKKLNSVCLAFIIVILSFAGCNDRVETPPDITTTVPDAVVTEPFDYGENVITQLKLPDLPDFKRFLSDPQYLPLGGSKLLTAYIDDGIFENTCVEICDLQTGEFSRVAVLQSAMTLCRALEDKKVLLSDSDGEYYVLSLDSGEAEKLDVPQPYGVFSRDMRTYYYTEDFLLCRMKLESGESEIIKNEYNINIDRIDGIYTENDLLFVCAYPSAYDDENSCGAVIDPADGSVLFLGDIMPGCGVGESFCGTVGAETGRGAIFTGSFGKGDEIKIVEMPELRGDEPSNLSFVNGSDYVFVQKYGDKESVRLWQLGAEVKECNLSACGIAGSVEQAAYIPEAELIIANAYDDGADTYSTVLIDLSAANFKDEREAKTAERDLLFNKSIIKEEVKWECPEELKNAQARAQQLEEKYGVRILIGDSCREFFQSTALETFVCNSPNDIENALENMEKAFKLYPENFLRGFNDAAGGSGIIFMLVGGIEDNCSGYTEEHFGKNLIAVNTFEYDVYSTVCHELWHAAENFITKYDPNAFDDEMWSDLNPEGFEYCNSRDCNAWSFMKKGVASAEKPENTYFIQSYGCSYAFEDRATIMEEVMTGDYGIENIRECPHLKAKLRLMAEAIRQFFDTEGWGTPRWEEPLK